VTNLPEHQHGADCGCYRPDSGQPIVRRRTPDAEYTTGGTYPLPVDTSVPPVVHVHQAAPDRTVQRLALGAGVGGGAVAAGVFFGPLLTAALASVAITLAVTAVCLAVAVWGVVTVVRAVGGPDGQDAARTVRKRRR
jgi:hypothetical protein